MCTKACTKIIPIKHRTEIRNHTIELVIIIKICTQKKSRKATEISSKNISILLAFNQHQEINHNQHCTWCIYQHQNHQYQGENHTKEMVIKIYKSCAQTYAQK